MSSLMKQCGNGAMKLLFLFVASTSALVDFDSSVHQARFNVDGAHNAKHDSYGLFLNGHSSKVSDIFDLEMVDGKAPRDISNEGECGVTIQVHEKSTRGKVCDPRCPLQVMDKISREHCSFRCVAPTIGQCKAFNPYTPVPDETLGICRACRVAGCQHCLDDGTDTCAECKSGHSLVNGKCEGHWGWLLYVALVGGGFVAACFALWVLDLLYRPITNQEGVDRGLRKRSFAKLRVPEDGRPHAQRSLYPWSTNLLRNPIAGLGVMHLFNFQMILIVWALFVLVTWLILALVVDIDLLRLGIRNPGTTPRDNCIIVAWGFTTQQRLMFAKIGFVGMLYIVTFVAAICYSIFHLRRHQRHSHHHISHQGYAAVCSGLPLISGDEHVEKELIEAVQRSTGEKVIGVSICWDFSPREDDIMDIMNIRTEDRLQACMTASLSPKQTNMKRLATQKLEDMETSMGPIDRLMLKWENLLLSPSVQRILKKQHGGCAMAKSSIRQHHKGIEDRKSRAPGIFSPRSPRSTASTSPDRRASTQSMESADFEDDSQGFEEIDVPELLHSLKTTEDAFIVFDTKAACDAAIRATAKEGISFRGASLTLVNSPCEPDAVLWNSYTRENWTHKFARFCVGLVCIILGLLVWCFCFYYPYAQSVITADYAQGDDPKAFSRTVFGFIVVAGNALMYVICAEVSDKIGFKYTHRREICYLVLYFFSCTFNVLLDLIMAYMMTYKQQVGIGMRTYHGELLADVTSLSGRFTTYGMQKSLGGLLYDYSFPSTFLIPFLIEPLVVIFIPYQIMVLIVRTHPAIMGQTADAYLASTPMDLSRYADILLNIMLAVIMFFFPGGYIVWIFGALVLSHLAIYFYDRYRVLRSIPVYNDGSMDVERCAQYILSIPIGLLLSCAAFKGNCHPMLKGYHCWKDDHLVSGCLMILFGHITLHMLLLYFFVPLFGRRYKRPSHVPYKNCAELFPCSWFSANPVHCLRSHYIYHIHPPCDHYIVGYDYVLRQNEKEHLYFYGLHPEVEHFDSKTVFEGAVRDVKAKASDLASIIKGSSTKSDLSSSKDGSPTNDDASP